MNQSRMTRLRTVEEGLAAGAEWQEIVVQVEFAACGDQPALQGPRYTYLVPAHRLRRGWLQKGDDDEGA